MKIELAPGEKVTVTLQGTDGRSSSSSAIPRSRSGPTCLTPWGARA